MLSEIYARNPRYGTGAYRRRVRLNAGPGTVTGSVNDDYHSMWVRIAHDGGVVRDVQSGLDRWPQSTCPGAIEVLREILGCPLDISRSAFYGGGRAGRNCTHLLDLAFWSLGHVRRGGGECVIDISVPDRIDGATRMQAAVDGVTVHDWEVEGDLLRAPEPLAGQRLFSGFAAWAEERFDGVVLDAARILQKGAFVARGRAYVVDGLPHRRANDEPTRLGACFTFSEPAFSAAINNVGYVQDFTDGIVEIPPPPDRDGEPA